ncbi:lipoprotein insertase outer membrane protein LolB [Limnohabitans sp. Rim8]|uniref:lipoprotein insertase outer membrane protein LolB n=1 Tax=Limnohabitans sp. Rim8 TaxID=1100718 RepID=UPI0025FE282F|nr:lipoprotein insertase outer membrane protein LolB [Limnohabitans sp. Rim8]
MKPSANDKAPLQKGRGRVLALALTSALLVAGCATPRLSPVDANAYWSGRMAIRVLKDPPESLSAGFELQGSAKAGEMVLLSPIGTTLARLDWTPQGAHLAQGQQQVSSPSLQKLGARLTGTELPIAALFEWLAGRPAEAPGWQVDLSAHAQGRISAERREPSPGAVLRIALDR